MLNALTQFHRSLPSRSIQADSPLGLGEKNYLYPCSQLQGMNELTFPLPVTRNRMQAGGID